MKQEIISQFRERPKTKAGRWALWLALATIFTPIVLGTFGAAIRPWIDRTFSENVGAAVGFSVGILALVLAALALVTSIRAYRLGERSWMAMIGLALAILVGLFWVFMIVGEFVFSH